MKQSAVALALILAFVLISGPAAAQSANGVTVDSSNGVILLASPAGAANCHAAITGAIRYNSTNPRIEFCNGTNWVMVGGKALISTQTASNSASLSWTGLGTSYNVYELVCSGVVGVNTSATPQLQFGEGATPTWEAANYTDILQESGNGEAWTATLNYTGGSAISLTTTGGILNINGHTGDFTAKFYNIPSSTLKKKVLWQGQYDQSTATYLEIGSGEYEGDSNAITAIRLILDNGNLNSGTCSLYGMN